MYSCPCWFCGVPSVLSSFHICLALLSCSSKFLKLSLAFGSSETRSSATRRPRASSFFDFLDCVWVRSRVLGVSYQPYHGGRGCRLATRDHTCEHKCGICASIYDIVLQPYEGVSNQASSFLIGVRNEQPPPTAQYRYNPTWHPPPVMW